ncbi:MAG: nucleotidyl transferase AbiEii/AbiGii toxin family protein [Patescibacteria group bacterium]
MHLEAITSEAKKILQELDKFSDFYLAGGTGLALQIGHRISVDFDFFEMEDISKNLLPKVKEIFRNSKIEVVVKNSSQLTIIVNGVNLSFIKYPFPVVSKFINYKGINILPPLEIAAMKAYALGRRAVLKDYVDLYYFLKEKFGGLKDIIKICGKKYGQEFDARLFLEQLIYSKDIEEMEVNFLKPAIGKKEAGLFFQKKIGEIKL